MDDFLSTPDSFHATKPADKNAAASPGAESDADSALLQITTELAAISANMFTKSDKADNEDLFEALTQLFTHILGEEVPDDFHKERAHRALRPPRRDGLPRDVICCLLSFQLKEAIMRAARQQSVTFRDASVSLYQDLSSLTLDAQRALRPLTCILQEKRIPYK
ncbi:Hypothetical predicted protein [Pelobates cultripes]|uniref:Uncharacterized protein n=1 Tax=Pelobates cultripes TaxID=61616 RepID=A0AAD1WE37_PELCU|nr:Hypothetical predicted protein [Pelobates cultripes]